MFIALLQGALVHRLQSRQNQQLSKGILLLLRWCLDDPVKDRSNHITRAAKDGIADIAILDERRGAYIHCVRHLELNERFVWRIRERSGHRPLPI